MVATLVMFVALIVLLPVFFRWGLIGWVPALYRQWLWLIGTGVLPFTKMTQRDSATPLAFPPDFFMPYCVCPHCNVEALHWMDDLVAKADEADELFKQVVSNWGRTLNLHKEYPCMSIEGTNLIKFRGRGMTVLRTCRECECVWAQKPGLQEKVAA